MNYSKIDAVLAAALESAQNPEEPALAVFIHIAHAPNTTETALLQELGVNSVKAGRKIFTATLSPRAVSELSEQPWVRYMKLSQKLRMLNEK